MNMKKLSLLLLLIAYFFNSHAQFKAYKIADSGLLYFIPSYMTKDGKQILYSYDIGSSKYTVYDDEFNIVKQYTPTTSSISYQVRVIKYTLLIDPDTKDFLTDWIVESDITQDNPVGYGGWMQVSICSEENNSSGLSFSLSQTLFDEDEDFEFIRPKNDVIPITTRTEDYIKDHSSEESNSDPQLNSDEWWREYGAESCEQSWDEEKQKIVYKLIKYERYGGLFFSGFEVVNLDGVVENTLEGIKSGGYTGYHVNGNFYIKRDDSNYVYQLNSHILPEINARGSNYDLNRDGKVDVADHVKLSDIIMGK